MAEDRAEMQEARAHVGEPGRDRAAVEAGRLEQLAAVYADPGALEGLRPQLVAMRKSVGLSQVEVARRMGVTQATVSRLESGARASDAATVRRYVVAVGGVLTCPVCGESGACAYDSEGRPLIHAHMDGRLDSGVR